MAGSCAGRKAKKRGYPIEYPLKIFSCGGLTRTDDLWVMSPTSYQLLHSAMLFVVLFYACKCKHIFYIHQILPALFSKKSAFCQISIARGIEQVPFLIIRRSRSAKSICIELSDTKWYQTEYLSQIAFLSSFVDISITPPQGTNC